LFDAKNSDIRPKRLQGKDMSAGLPLGGGIFVFLELFRDLGELF
jgi:hypothetical protein